MKPTLLVLAAGMGSRYGGLKQMDPVGPHGEVVLDYSVYDALRAGFGRIVFVVRRDIEADFRELVVRRFESVVPVECVNQELEMLPEGFAPPAGRRKPWGTGQAILVARGAVDTPFAVINADDFYGADSYRLLAAELTRPAGGPDTYAMVGFRLGNTLSEHGHVARGICRADADGYLVDVEEVTAIEKTPRGARHAGPDRDPRVFTGDELVSMNMWAFTPSLFAQLESRFVRFLERCGSDPKAEFFVPTVVSELISEGVARVRVRRTESEWFGVTYREDKPRVVAAVRELIAAGEYPERLWGT